MRRTPLSSCALTLLVMQACVTDVDGVDVVAGRLPPPVLSLPKASLFGSHNYTMNALVENDELLMPVDDADVFTAFVCNWTAVQAHHR